MEIINWLNKAYNYYNEGKYKESGEFCNLEIKRNPRNELAYNIRGCVRDELSDYAGAEEDYKKGIELAPKNPLMYNNLGYLYRDRKNDPEKALEYFSRAIEYNKGKYQYDLRTAYSGKADCLYKFGRLNESLAYYKIATKMRFTEYDPNKLVKLIYPDKIEKLEAAYKKLMENGFFPVCVGDAEKCFFVMPFYGDRMILFLNNFHISRTYEKHIKKMGKRYELSINTHFSEIMNRLDEHYLNKSEASMKRLRFIYSNKKDTLNDFQFISIALCVDGNLAAGALGAVTGKKSDKNRLYTGFTRFTDVPYSGKSLDYFFVQELRKYGFSIKDYGPSTQEWDKYKAEFGAVKMSTEAFIVKKRRLL